MVRVLCCLSPAGVGWGIQIPKSRIVPIPGKPSGAPGRIPTVPSEFSPAGGHPGKVQVWLNPYPQQVSKDLPALLCEHWRMIWGINWAWCNKKKLVGELFKHFKRLSRKLFKNLCYITCKWQCFSMCWFLQHVSRVYFASNKLGSWCTDGPRLWKTYTPKKFTLDCCYMQRVSSERATRKDLL